MKRMLIGTYVGRRALSVKGYTEYLVTALVRPEEAGTSSNDYLAGYLTTRLCRPRKTFLDVGAHIGSIVDQVLAHCPTAKVVAVEAIPEKAEHLRRKFPQVEVHACAMSEAEGEATFFIDRKASGYSSLGKPKVSEEGRIVEIRVPVRRLDDVVASRDVDVIKLDVEGAELGVLRGGGRLVADCRPVIMFESGPPGSEGLGYPKEDLWQWFADRDYAVLLPSRLRHEDPGLTRGGFVESHLYPRRTTNYFAVPAERRAEVRDRVGALLGG